MQPTMQENAATPSNSFSQPSSAAPSRNSSFEAGLDALRAAPSSGGAEFSSSSKFGLQGKEELVDNPLGQLLQIRSFINAAPAYKNASMRYFPVLAHPALAFSSSAAVEPSKVSSAARES